MNEITRDEGYMHLALMEAGKALALHEIAVGAVIVKGGSVVASGYNRRELDRDPTAHAEIVAIRRAAEVMGDWRLTGCELFCTLEPCAMCAGAIATSRLRRLVFGAFDPAEGFFGSRGDISAIYSFPKEMEILGGVLEESCLQLLRASFTDLRC